MDEHGKARTADLSKIFQDQDDQGSHIGRRLNRMVRTAEHSETPPIPRQIQIETTNICNHACDFCAYPDMVRPKTVMKPELFRRLVKEAFDLGAREIGLFAGAEPLTCKSLEEFVSYCKDVGYEYMYISTNGALATQDRFKRLLDAGLSSIKFSINAGTAETYQRVHGKDDLHKVLANVRYVSEYRKTLGRSIYLGVSFVATPATAADFEALKSLVSPYVEEIVYYEANNQSGQKDDLPLPPFKDCVLPFNKLHISAEGYIKACCNDYDNQLAIEDLNKAGIREAWLSERFRALRRRHMTDDLDGTLCGKCVRNSRVPVAALNPELLSQPVRIHVLKRMHGKPEADPIPR